MIRFENVSKRYPDGTSAVESLNLEIKEGEFFVLIGPSGCGKTTTLKMINRLIELSDGTIFINGKKVSEFDIYELRWDIGYVLQQIALFPHMTIEENIAVVPELKKWGHKRTHNRVSELLEMVGLEAKTYRNRKPDELSGGQQQRIGVIRALAADPKIILMDEPFSALDPISREKLQDELIDLQRRIKKTIVFVTHDMQEALKLGDRICVMKEGKVIQIGTPKEILENPTNNFVSEFVGNQQMLMNDGFSLAEIMEPYNEKHTLRFSAKAVPISTPFKEILAALMTEDQLAIEKDGFVVGTINRKAVITYMAKQLQEGRRRNG